MIIEEELEGYALPRATPNKFNDYHQRSNDKVREIDISMIIPTPFTSENNNPSNCICRSVFGTCYKRLFQGLPVCIKYAINRVKGGSKQVGLLSHMRSAYTRHISSNNIQQEI